MSTPVGEAWEVYYKPGMSDAEARAFKAGFYSGIAMADTEEEPDVLPLDPLPWASPYHEGRGATALEYDDSKFLPRPEYEQDRNAYRRH